MSRAEQGLVRFVCDLLNFRDQPEAALKRLEDVSRAFLAKSAAEANREAEKPPQ